MAAPDAVAAPLRVRPPIDVASIPRTGAGDLALRLPRDTLRPVRDTLARSQLRDTLRRCTWPTRCTLRRRPATVATHASDWYEQERASMSAAEPPSLPEIAETLHQHGVLLERLSSKVDAVIEGIAALTDHGTRSLGDLESKLSARIELLEQVVRQNSVDIQKNSADIRQNSADIQVLRIDIAGLRYDFDRHLGRADGLEERVAAVEQRLGIVPR